MNRASAWLRAKLLRLLALHDLNKIQISSDAGSGTSKALFIAATKMPKFDVLPSSGRAGITVRLSGIAFKNVLSVLFNGVASPHYVQAEPVPPIRQLSKFEIEVTVPAGAITGTHPAAVPVEVNQSGGSFVSSARFTIIP